jgi:glycerophosphoryl diester phosphodiesterase
MIRDLLQKKPLVIAHRGDPLAKPQNTASAFLSAAQYDIDMIETDINMTRDGKLVVIHDQEIDHVSNGSGKVMDFTLSQLKGFDYGSWMGADFAGEGILTIEEFIELVTDKVPALNIEIKNGPIYYEGIEQKLVDAIKKFDIRDRVIISSFDHHAIKQIKELDGHITTAILFSGRLIDPITPAKLAGADGIHPEFRWVTGETVTAAGEAGLFVNVWTVDGDENIQLMRDIGVTGIISNFPGKLSQIIKE